MFTRRSLALTFVALIVSGIAASAQSPSGKVFARYSKPLRSVHVDLATGTITRGPKVSNRTGTTVVDFDNNDLSGFVGVDTGAGFCEWFDAGTKGRIPNNSDLMTDITFAYCSAMLAPGSGGPGGSVKLGFYEGYAVFGGAPTTGVMKYTLTGLPANSASSSFFGGFSCYFTDIAFHPAVPFADGPIGYSWKFLDLGTDGTLAGTWPFLSCVASCSGALGQTDGSGMLDAIDEYCPPGTLRSTFSFGTTSGTFTSMSLDIREIADTASSKVNYNATLNPNTDTLSSLNPIVGATWTVTLTRSPVTAAGSFLLVVQQNRVAAPNGNPPPTGVEGRVLTAAPTITSLSSTHNGTTGSASYPIPAEVSLVCLHFAVQSLATPASAGFTARLSSAIEGTTGTF